MAAVTSNQSAKRVENLIGLAQRILQELQQSSPISQQVRGEISNAVYRGLPLHIANIRQEDRNRCDELGCKLWNASLGVHQDRDAVAAPTVMLRALAFLLIDVGLSATPNNIKRREGEIRCMRIAIKTAQHALLNKSEDVALKVLERCSDLNDSLHGWTQMVKDSSEELHHCRLLIQSYHLLRIQHAQSVVRLDLAEHFLPKLDLAVVKSSLDLTTKAALAFFECACSVEKANKPEIMSTWLDRALAVLTGCEDSAILQQTEDLRLSITLKALHILSLQESSDAFNKAWKLAFELDTVYGLGTRLQVQLAQLNVVLASDPLRKDLIVQLMSKIIDSPTDKTTFTLLQKTIHKVHSADAVSAQYSLERLILHKLAPKCVKDGGEQIHLQQLHQAVMLYTHYLTSDSLDSIQQNLNTLSSLFNAIYDQTESALAPTPTHAIQTLLWRLVEDQESQTKLLWIKILQHPLLGNSGPANKACIGRKAIMVYLEVDDTTAARKAFFELPPQAAAEPRSRYLAYKTALRSNDHVWAAENLQLISASGGTSDQLLYECVKQAQQSSDRSAAMMALQTIVDKSSNKDINLVLLRSLTRLRIGELEKPDLPTKDAFEVVVRLFERSTATASRSTAKECEWWMKTSFNLAVKFFHTDRLDHVIRLLRTCIAHHNSSESARSDGEQEKRHKIFQCYYMISSALILEARMAQQDREGSLQDYLEARQHIARYFKQPSVGNDDKELRRAFELRRFDLEAVFRLQQWDQLDAALIACLSFDSVDRWDRLADLVLIIHKELITSDVSKTEHIPQILELLQKIINESWKRDRSIVQVARWVRTAISINMAHWTDANEDDKVALKLLDGATSLAIRGMEDQDARYPEDELQWLAIIAFNRGIDHCIRGKEMMTWKWFDAALEMAKCANDDGALHNCLVDRRAKAEEKLAKQRQ